MSQKVNCHGHKPTQKGICQLTINDCRHTRLVLSQPVMSAAPAVLLFDHHYTWAGVLWRCGGRAPVPVPGDKSMSTACKAKKEKQNSKGAASQTDPSTLKRVGDTRQQHCVVYAHEFSPTTAKSAYYLHSLCYRGTQVTLDAICMRRLVACLLTSDKARHPLTGCTRPFLYLTVVLGRDGCGCCTTSLHVLLQHCYEWRCSAFCCLCTIQSLNSAICHHCMATLQTLNLGS